MSGQQYSTTKSDKVIEQATMTTNPSKQTKSIDLNFKQARPSGKRCWASTK